MKRSLIVGALIALLVVATAVALYSGAYGVAADEPHWTLTERLLSLVRQRAIAARANDRVPGDFTHEKRIASGARQYAEMCEGCHLAPGVADTELRRGLYPKPPELARERLDARQAFWVVKHGIKMTGMPAWGPTHDDETLWNVVAFLQKLPELDAGRYRALVGKAAPPMTKAPGAAGHSHDAHPHHH